MENYIVTFSTILIVFGLYKLFEKLLPVSNAEFRTFKTLEELRGKYLVVDLKQIGIFILLTIGFVFLFDKLFSVLIDYKISRLSDVTIIVKPTSTTILFISLFSGMLLAALIVFVISRRIIGSDWEEYLAYSNLKYKFNFVKVSKYTSRIFGIITGLLIIAFCDWYSAFGQQEIKINRLLSLGTKTYEYSGINKIKRIEKVKAPNGDIINDPHFIIEFLDGEKWNSRDSGFGDYNQDHEIIDLIIGKTKLETIQLELDNE